MAGFVSLSILNKDFPVRLREISDAPHTLYARGDLALLGYEPKIAIIGSRRPTPYGEGVAWQLATQLAACGVCIVSGLALGIDGIAHRAALSALGKTIAVLGTAIDQSYPRSHRGLSEQIAEQGLIISEHGPGAKTHQGHFATRNRLISGLARAVIIVEAAEQSGTLVTARYALAQDREIFAVPGPVDAPNSVGTLALIRNGARPIRSADDVLEDLNLTDLKAARFENKKLNEYNDRSGGSALMPYLSERPLHVDELAELTGKSIATLQHELVTLELAGQVRKLPGQRYLKGL